MIAIILLASMVALPAIYSSLSGRQVTDAARIFTGSLVGARDSAIRYNQPRGIRLLPDPTLTIPPPGQAGAGEIQLCYNRMISIEPAGDYSQGTVTIGPYYYPGGSPTGFPPAYPRDLAGTTYPYPDSSTIQQAWTSRVLMVEESFYAGGYVVGTGEPRSPTNWYWNVRVGDKIKINGTGRAYTIVGPCTVNPWGTGANLGNPEMFVNVGAPGTTSPLARTYYTRAAGPPVAYTKYGVTRYPEFLFLVNGEDDDNDGYADDGWDNFNQNPPPPPGPPPAGTPPRNPQPTDDNDIDDLFEWEYEKWVGSLVTESLVDIPGAAPLGSPTQFWAEANLQKGTQDVGYIIQRRPVPSEGAREFVLPAGMVIDATTWNSTRERSRIPVSSGSLYCDIMVNPGGLYIPTTEYSAPTSANPLPFLHFWITDRNDVHPRGSIWGMLSAGVPAHHPSDPGQTALDPYVYYELPMPAGTTSYPPTTKPMAPLLKNDRRLVTMFAQSGLVVANTIETIPSPSTTVPGEGFDVNNVSNPFYRAQQGLREAR